MCGQCGVYNHTSFSTPEYEIFQRLLFVNVFRGQDSTGIIRVGKDGRSMTRKTLLASPDFLKDAKMSDIVRPQFRPEAPMALLGHCRAATKGAVSLKNSHPFGFDRVVGMHNGTIHTSFKGKSDYETDSEAFYKLLNDEGLEKALEEIQAYDTAYAFQWIDKKDRTLNFIKNDKRPLHFTYAYGGTALIWSSEQEALELVLNARNTTYIGWKGSTTDKIFTLHKNQLLSIKLGERADSGILTQIEVPEKKVHTYYTQTNIGTKYSDGATPSSKTYTKVGEWRMTPLGYQFVPTIKAQSKELSLTQEIRDTISKEASQNTKDTSKSSSKSNTEKQSSTKGGSTYKNFRDAFGKNKLKELAWLHPVDKKDEADGPNYAAASDHDLDQSDILNDLFDTIGTEHMYPGYKGESVRESKFKYILGGGCGCCGKSLELDNPHDFDDINKIHWFDSISWFCDTCYTTSEGDWVRHSVDDSWDEYGKNLNK